MLAHLPACLPSPPPLLPCPPAPPLQECVLEKAINDRKSPGIVARVAKQAAVFYRECAALLSAAPLSQVGGCWPVLGAGDRGRSRCASLL